MFYTFLPKLINMSMTASVAIVFVLLLRLLLRRAPKVISYALWGVVLFRLLCPVSIGTGFSLYNLFDAPTEESGTITSVIEYVPSNIVHTEYPSVSLPVPGISNVINEALPQGREQMVADPLEAPVSFATYIWMIGVLVLIVYSIASYIQLRRKLAVVIPLRDNIFIADDIKSPFVVGLLRPKIYLPCNLGKREQEYIILHEQHHIKRLDHIVKALAFLALTVHWFNPLVWLAFVLAGKDMEMSCDEAVIRKLGSDVRADYSASLLTLATGRRIISGTPLAFGEGDTKGRINNLAKWKKPAVFVVVLATIACVVLAVGLLTNPANNRLHAPEPFCHTYKVEEILFDDPKFSFMYSVETAPIYQFTSDYGMLVADSSNATEWVWQRGKCEEVKITNENFDNYFDMSGFQISNDRWSKFRNSIKKVWRIDVENSENNVFYYLISTLSEEVYLTYGYHDPEGETDPHSDDSSIRWLFKLARTDLLTCNALSEKLNSFVELAYFPDTDIERDTDHWPVAYINESGVLQFSLEGNADTLVVSEDYYRKSEGSTFIERNTFEIVRNADGFFTIDIARRESLEDHVNYFIKIKGQSDVYVMKVVFADNTQMQFAGELIPGTTYVPYQCLYMNPLSSYAAMGGDSSCKYVVGEDHFTTIYRRNSVSINATNPALDSAGDVQNMIDVPRWKWQEFPYTDEEWALLYWPKGLWSIENISEQYSEMLYQPLTSGKFLLKMDNSLWLVDISNDPKVGTYIWSIYSLVPETAMGAAQWEYAPMLSSRIPVFPFDFDLEHTEISAYCSNGSLGTYGVDSGSSMTIKNGETLYWSPVSEDGTVVNSAIINFSVRDGETPTYNGTIYIEGSTGSDGRTNYTATIVGTGLHLDSNAETYGGVISEQTP